MDEIAYDQSYGKFVDMFNNFLKKGVMAGTYKVVFLRALTDIGKDGDSEMIGKQWIHHENGRIRLELDFIAIRFIKYYWDMEIAFKMKHMPSRMADADDPEKDTINVIKLIRACAADMKKEATIKTVNNMDHETLNESKQVGIEIQNMLQLLEPPTIKKLASDEMKKFREDVIKASIKPEVLRHLLNDMPNLYERVRGENYILLDPAIIGFMKKFYLIIRKALNCVLAEHLEKNNPSARHIATKIDSEKEFDSRLDQVKKLEVQVDPKPINDDDESTSQKFFNEIR